MLTRHLAGIALAFTLISPDCLRAQEQDANAEMKQLQVLLAVFNSELKADLEQILALQEALKANARPLLMAQGRTPEPASYEAIAEEQRLAIQRETALNARLNALLSRSAALDARKLPILDRMRELSLPAKR
jgi:hypothetical protein